MPQTQDNSSTSNGISLFEAFGIELEYMIVQKDTLNVLPITDKLFFDFVHEYVGDVVHGPISLNNELAAHVVEFKTTEPAKTLTGLPQLFNTEIFAVNKALESYKACLMPTAMHPWMNSLTEMRLWPHGCSEIYDTLHRIFDCRGHGWANLQSTHINLPFADEEEFVRLHAAIRLVLPLIPTIAASSPFADGEATGLHDTRLETYKHNAKRIFSVTGHVIPEACRSYQDYHTLILNKIYRDLEPYDHEGVLRYEWVNSRGAIARFDRGAIEIRLVDVQETPIMDLSVAATLTELVRALVQESWAPLETYHAFGPERLKVLLDRGIRLGEDALIDDIEYLKLFGWKSSRPCSAKELWKELLGGTLPLPPEYQTAMQLILSEGTLATRIAKAVGPNVNKSALNRTYSRLCQCLASGESFLP